MLQQRSARRAGPFPGRPGRRPPVPTLAGLALAALLVVGCDDASGNGGTAGRATGAAGAAAEDRGGANATQRPTSGPVPEPAGDPGDRHIDLVAIEVLPPKGSAPTRIDPGTAPLVLPAGAALRLETLERLDDYRVRLAGPDGRLVPATIESGPVLTRGPGRAEPGGTWIRIAPGAEAHPGAHYEVRIEGERSDQVTAADGRALEDLVLPLEIAAP